MNPIFFLFLFFFLFTDAKAQTPDLPQIDYCEIVIEDARTSKQSQCLGFLISGRVVITASHCLNFPEDFTPEKIHVACHDRAQEFSEIRTASFPLDENNPSISEQLPPDFNSNLHDITALYLKKPMELSTLDILFDGNPNQNHWDSPLINILSNENHQCFMMKSSNVNFYTFSKGIVRAGIVRTPLIIPPELKPLRLEGLLLMQSGENDIDARHYSFDSLYDQPLHQTMNFPITTTVVNRSDWIYSHISAHLGMYISNLRTGRLPEESILLSFNFKNQEDQNDHANGTLDYRGSSGSSIVCQTTEGGWKAIGVLRSEWIHQNQNKKPLLVELLENHYRWPLLLRGAQRTAKAQRAAKRDAAIREKLTRSSSPKLKP